MKAASLSWILFLTIIPMLILVLSIASRILSPGENIIAFTRLFYNLLDQFTPTQISQIQSLVDQAFQASVSSSIAAFAIMLWSLLGFYSWIERIFNSIWKIAYKRKYLVRNRFRGLGIITLMILFLVFSLFFYNMLLLILQLVESQTSFMISPKIYPSFLYLFNLALAGFTFFTFFKWIPSRKVKTKAALYAALVSLAIEEIALFGYQFYLKTFSKASFIYGSMFSMIVLLVWMDYTMITLLFGCEFCKTLNQLLPFRYPE